MPIDCPACGKVAQTGGRCGRCGCDLAVLERIVRAAAHCADTAAAALGAADWDRALDQAQRSWRLCRGAQAARLGFLAATGRRDAREILRWHARTLREER